MGIFYSSKDRDTGTRRRKLLMALVTVIKFVMTFAFAYVLFILFGPLVYQMAYNSSWSSLPVSEIAFRDQTYGIWVLIIVIVAAVLLVTAWREAERKAAQQ